MRLQIIGRPAQKAKGCIGDVIFDSDDLDYANVIVDVKGKEYERLEVILSDGSGRRGIPKE